MRPFRACQAERPWMFFPSGILMTLVVFGCLGIVGLSSGKHRGSRPVSAAAKPAATASSPPGASVNVAVQVPASMRFSPFDVTRSLKVPPNFGVSVYARISDARFMAVAPNGDLFVSQPDAGGQVSVVRPNGDSDPQVFTYISGLTRPHDIVFHTIGGTTYVYISETNQIDRFIYNTGDTSAHDEQIVVSGLPNSSTPGLGGTYNHELKNIALDSNDMLYVSIGSTCNVCTIDTTSDPLRAAIYQYNADGTGGHVFAQGLRNAEGLALLPGTTDLWVVVNERDNIAYPFNDSTGQYGQVITSYVANHPPDEFTRVRSGGNYGWPFCDPDPDTSAGLDNMPFDDDYQMNQSGQVDCTSMDRISKGIQAHSAPLGLAFLQGTAFPEAYSDGAVVASHGSWDRDVKTGYKVMYFPWNDSTQTPGAEINLVTGWLNAATQQAWGRPVDIAVDSVGDLLISDDSSGTIYKLFQTSAIVPTITGATAQGKNIVVTGTGFDKKAVVLVNGAAVRTGHAVGQLGTLTAKKALKLIPVGQSANLQVQDSTGAISPAFPFTRS
jgi:glucose/arabinose dehydrogenase